MFSTTWFTHLTLKLCSFPPGTRLFHASLLSHIFFHLPHSFIPESVILSSPLLGNLLPVLRQANLGVLTSAFIARCITHYTIWTYSLSELFLQGKYHSSTHITSVSKGLPHTRPSREGTNEYNEPQFCKVWLYIFLPLLSTDLM